VRCEPGQGLEMDRGLQQQKQGLRRQRGLLGSNDPNDQDVHHVHTTENRTRQIHVCKCDSDRSPALRQGQSQEHQQYVQAQQQNDTTTAPFPLHTPLPATALHSVTASDSAPSSYSSASSTCMCSDCSMATLRVASPPQEGHKSISSAFLSLELAPELSKETPISTGRGMGGCGEASNTIVPPLALWPSLFNSDCMEAYSGHSSRSCNNNNNNNNNPAAQSFVVLPSLVSKIVRTPKAFSEEHLLPGDVDTGAGVGPSTVPPVTRVQAPCNLVHGFHSLHDHLPDGRSCLSTFDTDSSAEPSTSVPYMSNTRAMPSNIGYGSIMCPRESYSASSSLANPQGSLMSQRFASLPESAGNYESNGKEPTRRRRNTQRKPGFDKLPREIKIHIFRYLLTYQLVRVSRVTESRYKPTHHQHLD
jgi:hypothetical protein